MLNAPHLDLLAILLLSAMGAAMIGWSGRRS
jgi:hypothetical protein